MSSDTSMATTAVRMSFAASSADNDAAPVSDSPVGGRVPAREPGASSVAWTRST